MKWTQEDDDYLRREYSDRPNADLAMWLHRSVLSIKARANRLGLRKSPEFAEGQKRKNQFKVGQKPFNRGRELKYWMSPEGQIRSSKGRFQPGVLRSDNPNSRKNKPIGHEKLYSDGYVWIITENGRKQKHRHVWEQANGPIPPGYCVKFRDGDVTNCSLDNLYLVSRADHLREQMSRRTPERRAEIWAKAQATRNKSIRRDRLLLKWGLEPEGKLIKRI